MRKFGSTIRCVKNLVLYLILKTVDDYNNGFLAEILSHQTKTQSSKKPIKKPAAKKSSLKKSVDLIVPFTALNPSVERSDECINSSIVLSQL